jgi:hypothetical protein
MMMMVVVVITTVIPNISVRVLHDAHKMYIQREHHVHLSSVYFLSKITQRDTHSKLLSSNRNIKC